MTPLSLSSLPVVPLKVATRLSTALAGPPTLPAAATIGLAGSVLSTVTLAPATTEASSPGAPRGRPKFSTAAPELPTLTTLAGIPGASVLTVPTATVAAAPCGMSKSNTASLGVPILVTSAGTPGPTVVTLPTATVAASPWMPWRPEGMPKFSTMSSAVPTFTTVAGEPGGRVVTVPTATEALMASIAIRSCQACPR